MNLFLHKLVVLTCFLLIGGTMGFAQLVDHSDGDVWASIPEFHWESGNFSQQTFCEIVEVVGMATAGAKSLKISKPVGDDTKIRHYRNTSSTGSYTLGMDVYIESETVGNFSEISCLFKNKDLITEDVRVRLNVSGIERGTWVSVFEDFDVAEGGYDKAGVFIQILEGGNVGVEGVVYVDNITLQPRIPTLVGSNDSFNYNVYPNPATENFRIDAPQGSDLAIYDMVGKKVFNQINIDNLTSISTSDLPSGIYLVKITNNGKSYTQKVQVL